MCWFVYVHEVVHHEKKSAFISRQAFSIAEASFPESVSPQLFQLEMCMLTEKVKNKRINKKIYHGTLSSPSPTSSQTQKVDQWINHTKYKSTWMPRMNKS